MDDLIYSFKNGEQAMINKKIERYLENHYQKFLGEKYKIKVTHLVDKGYYYQFYLWKDGILTIGETVWKNDIDKQYITKNF